MKRPVLKKTMNIIVYDNTETVNPNVQYGPSPGWMQEMMGAEPGSLTWWWKMGGILQSARKMADAVGGVASWQEALQFTVDSIKEAKTKSRQPIDIGVVQFWGHGSPGAAYMGGKPLHIGSLSPDNSFYETMEAFKSLLTPNFSSVWFRSCSTFHGQGGKDFAIAYRDYFNTRVIGHTYDISALQSGTYLLEPYETPNWPDEEGNKDSGLYEPHTITAVRFYPPANW